MTPEKETTEIGKLDATEERKQIVRHTIGRIAAWAKERKMDVEKSALNEDATLGFNLACDFLSHELVKMQEFHHKDILK